MTKARVLYLYSKLPPYQIPVLKNLVDNENAIIDVVYWSTPGNAPYTPPSVDGVTYHPKEQLSKPQLFKLINDLRPDIIFISGWQDKDYMEGVLPYRRKGTPVVIGFDDIWTGSWRQRLGRYYYKFWLSRYYSHAWVSGPRQYEFAKKLFFKDKDIISNLYSGDTALFSNFYSSRKSEDWDKVQNFLFVGRFVPAKAIDILIKGFEYYKKELGGSWNLICIGKGEWSHLITGKESVTVYNHLGQSEIVKLLHDVGAFTLASRTDVSPLVVHEFASAGLPLILSDAIGNRQIFLINGYNGFTFESENHIDLAHKMLKISNLSKDTLMQMGHNSHKLSRIHNPEFVAASLMSILKK